MKAAALLSTVALLLAAAPASAQFRSVQPEPKTWTSVWLGGYLGPGTVADPQTGYWDFGSAIGGGIDLHRRVGSSLSIGIETSFAPSSYEIRQPNAGVVGKGKARLVTSMLTGRLRYGGSQNFGMYLTGGAGAFIYGMPELDRWDPDFAFKTGAGLEYRPARNRALFVEWGRYWTFHQKEGVRDNTVQHSDLRAGFRLGL